MSFGEVFGRLFGWLYPHNLIRKSGALLDDSSMITELSWDDAYRDCADCLDYYDAHAYEYDFRFSKEYLWPYITVWMILVLVTTVYLRSFNLFLVAGITVATILYHFLYYYHIDYHLMWCTNRLNTYSNRWPGMINAIRTGIFEEPGKTVKVEETNDNSIDDEMFSYDYGLEDGLSSEEDYYLDEPDLEDDFDSDEDSDQEDELSAEVSALYNEFSTDND